MPRNGYENELLKTAKAQAGIGRVWLNYTDSGNGVDWVGGPAQQQAPAAPAPSPLSGLLSPLLSWLPIGH